MISPTSNHSVRFFFSSILIIAMGFIPYVHFIPLLDTITYIDSTSSESLHYDVAYRIAHQLAEDSPTPANIEAARNALHANDDAATHTNPELSSEPSFTLSNAEIIALAVGVGVIVGCVIVIFITGVGN